MATNLVEFGAIPFCPPPFPPVLPELPPPALSLDLWPLLGTPLPNLRQRGMTEARCVVGYFHGRTTDEELDALQHLANICTIKASGKDLYWQQRPSVRFVGARTSRMDPENYWPYRPDRQKATTRYWFLTNLPGHISKYSPEFVTRRELLELARMKDADLLHVCHSLVCDMVNAAVKDARHELPLHLGVEVEVTAPVAPVRPDYRGAVQALVRNPDLRNAFRPYVRTTLEFMLRKLDAGVDPTEIIALTARDLKQDERTIRRHLEEVRAVVKGASAPSAMREMVDSVIPPVLPYRDAHPTPRSPSKSDWAEESF